MDTKEKIQFIAKCLDDKKGRRITALGVENLTSVSDCFIIASGGSPAQVKALADNVTEKMSEKGINFAHMEGYNVASWILIDYSDVIVHIFLEETREFYDIERLWTDASAISLEIDE